MQKEKRYTECIICNSPPFFYLLISGLFVFLFLFAFNMRMLRFFTLFASDTQVPEFFALLTFFAHLLVPKSSTFVSLSVFSMFVLKFSTFLSIFNYLPVAGLSTFLSLFTLGMLLFGSFALLSLFDYLFVPEL